MWNVTTDDSVVDQHGKVLFFSTRRFIEDICLGDCCFICGAKSNEKPFNNEHILPEWLLRRYNLFARTITAEWQHGSIRSVYRALLFRLQFIDGSRDRAAHK